MVTPRNNGCNIIDHHQPHEFAKRIVHHSVQVFISPLEQYFALLLCKRLPAAKRKQVQAGEIHGIHIGFFFILDTALNILGERLRICPQAIIFLLLIENALPSIIKFYFAARLRVRNVLRLGFSSAYLHRIFLP